MIERECLTCHGSFPLDADHFYQQKDPRGSCFRRVCKECVRRKMRGYRSECPHVVTEKSRAKSAEAARRYRQIPQNRMSLNISKGIRRSIKSKKAGRHWEDILGYTIADLTSHLESQFTKGMCWDNYGEWHIDHIRPIADFNISSPDDPAFNECWSLWNLCPMWAKANHRKSFINHEPPLPLPSGEF